MSGNWRMVVAVVREPAPLVYVAYEYVNQGGSSCTGILVSAMLLSWLIAGLCSSERFLVVGKRERRHESAQRERTGLRSTRVPQKSDMFRAQHIEKHMLTRRNYNLLDLVVRETGGRGQRLGGNVAGAKHRRLFP